MPELPETDPALAEVLAELVAREPIFHRPELGTAQADFDGMMAQDFWEVGASGARYGRALVLDLLAERHTTPQLETLEPFDFRCRALGADTYLVTYTLLQGERTTRRATIWQQAADGWKIVYHQGTVVAE